MRLTFDNNYFNALYQGIPIGGYTKLVEHLLEGIEVRLNTDYLEQKEELDKLAETVVYTGPIDAYFGYSLGALEYRSVRFEAEVLDIPNFQGNAAVNYTDRETPWTGSSSTNGSSLARTNRDRISRRRSSAESTVPNGSREMSLIIRSMMKRTALCMQSIKGWQIRKRT